MRFLKSLLLLLVLGLLLMGCEFVQVQKYTVTFMDDGVEITKVTVIEGSNVTAPASPTKEGFIFTGWDKDFTNVQSNLVVNAVFAKETYTVVFRVDGVQQGEAQIVNYGETATSPVVPKKEGFKFVGWDKAFDNVQGDLVVNAIYVDSNTVTYTVVFRVDGVQQGNVQIITHGSSATSPANPTKEGFTFTGWDKDFTNVTSNLEINAVFVSNTATTFTVVFKVDGVQRGNIQTVAKGESAMPPTNITKVGFKFVGWDRDFTNIQSDLVINAVFVAQYTVVFKVDGIQMFPTQTVSHGETSNAPLNPTKTGYEFIGWDKPYTNVTSNLEINAIFKVLKYNVLFKVDGATVSTQAIEYGKGATAPANPTKEGFAFIGWDKSFSNITSELVVNAMFAVQYTVVFKVDGAVVSTQTVNHGAAATAPASPSKIGYTFTGWDKTFINVTSNLEINAVFVPVGGETSYALNFYDGTTKLSLGVSSYKPSEEITLPVPTKAGYAFVGWFLSDISLCEIAKIQSSFNYDLTLYSRWISTQQSQLTAPANVGEFTQINKNPHSSGSGYVYQPVFPSGASTSVTLYNWASSNTSVATISAYSSISIASAGYAIITATLKTNSSVVYWCVIKTSADGVVKSSLEEANAPNYVTVTFKLSDTQTVQKPVLKGGFAVAPTPLPKFGHIFTGWVGQNGETIYNISKNTTFIPTYEVGANSYAGKTISVLGDSITTYAGYIPTGFPYFYPYPTAELSDVNQTWWMQFINYFGMKLLVDNAYSGSTVTGTGSSAAQTTTRLSHLYIGDIKPDVVLILMGANDAGSSYITLSQFNTAYGIMINNIKSASPNSEIILCTLPSITLYTEADQISYNNAIKQHATTNSLKVLDFAKAFTRAESTTYLVDSAHPNKAGMIKIANVAIADFKAVIK
ncbi:MAG: InlB B-repeat-containing protein [Bacilli bacterium]|jgi:uncharacterized repeat protein (TIGR02543 family)